MLHRVLIKPLPAGASANVAGNSKNTALRRERELAVLRRRVGIRLARVAITPHQQRRGQSFMPLVWSCGVLFRRAAASGHTQKRGEHRDRGRVLNALRETLPGPGAARIIRAGLPDRGALLVAEGLPGSVTGRASPVRPSRRRRPRITGGRVAGARDGTTPGRSLTRTAPGARAPASVPR